MWTSRCLAIDKARSSPFDNGVSSANQNKLMVRV